MPLIVPNFLYAITDINFIIFISVEIAEPKTAWKSDAVQLSKRSSHSVSEKALTMMLSKWYDFYFLNLSLQQIFMFGYKCRDTLVKHSILDRKLSILELFNLNSVSGYTLLHAIDTKRGVCF